MTALQNFQTHTIESDSSIFQGLKKSTYLLESVLSFQTYGSDSFRKVFVFSRNFQQLLLQLYLSTWSSSQNHIESHTTHSLRNPERPYFFSSFHEFCRHIILIHVQNTARTLIRTSKYLTSSTEHKPSGCDEHLCSSVMLINSMYVDFRVIFWQYE